MDQHNPEQNNQPEAPETKPGLRAYISKPVAIAALTVAAAASICLIIALLVSGSPESNASVESPETEQSAVNSVPLYEEPMEGDLDDMVKQIDLSLINTLKAAKISMSCLLYTSPSPRD